MSLPKPKYRAASLQEEIRLWWQNNPMTYDWRSTNQHAEGTREWFEEIDKRFFNEITSFFAQAKGTKPFSSLIPFADIKGKEVLEIGCGTGAHARLLAEAGAKLTAIDLTEKAIALTRRRLQVYGLEGNISQMDAEAMSFPDSSFDFVWSWGVIHHSSNTEKVIGEIARVLKPGGQVRLMVYHLRSINALMSLVRGSLSGRLFRDGIKETLNYYSDGRVANYYSKAQFSALFQREFCNVSVSALGQKNELLPFPGVGPFGSLKVSLSKAVPDTLAKALLSYLGGFLFLTATRNSKQ